VANSAFPIAFQLVEASLQEIILIIPSRQYEIGGQWLPSGTAHFSGRLIIKIRTYCFWFWSR